MRHFRAVVDFTVFERSEGARVLSRQLLEEEGSPFANEDLGRLLDDEIMDGHVEIDAISSIEDHGEGPES